MMWSRHEIVNNKLNGLNYLKINLRKKFVYVFVIVLVSMKISKATDMNCYNGYTIRPPPLFPDFMSIFKSTLRHFPPLLNLTRNLQDKLIKENCLNYAPLFKTDWNEYKAKLCSGSDDVTQEDMFHLDSSDETCKDVDYKDEVSADNEDMDFNINLSLNDFKTRREGVRYNAKQDDNKQMSTKRKAKKEHENIFLGVKLKSANNNKLAPNKDETMNMPMTDFNLDPEDRYQEQRGGDHITNRIKSDKDDNKSPSSDSTNLNKNDDGRWRHTQSSIVPMKNEIMLAIIILSVLASVIFIVSVILLRHQRVSRSVPHKNNIQQFTNSKHWYNDKPSTTRTKEGNELNFIEDRLCRNYKTHPVKRYL